MLSLRKYAKHRGVTLYAVQRAIESGRITAGNSGIDQEQADRDWDANTDQSKSRTKPGARQPQELVTTDDDGVEKKSKGKKKKPNYAESRALREQFNAKTAQLEYEEKIGLLVSADLVKRQAFDTARVVRDAILNIPNRFAAELAAETDPVKISIQLTKALTEALEELSRAQKKE